MSEGVCWPNGGRAPWLRNRLMTHKDRTPRFSLVRFFYSSLAVLGVLVVLSGCASRTDASTQEAPSTLVEAVFRGDVEEVKRMLDRGDSPAVYGERKWHPLHYTASPEDEGDREHDLEIARLLVEAGADINARTDVGFTALHLAVANERDELRNYFLDIGAEVNTELEDKWTPIVSAIDVGDPEAVRSLLEAGAKVGAPVPKICPLHYVAKEDPQGTRNSDVEIARMLLKANARIDCWGRAEATPLYLATLNDRPEVMEVLLEAGADIDQKAGGTRGTPLRVAIFKGNIRQVKLLLDHGATVIGNGLIGFPMHYTVMEADKGQRQNDDAITELLLEAGADINDREILGHTALHLAIKHRRYDRIEELLARGAEIDTNNDYGHSTLMTAISMGDVEMVETLLDAGANPDHLMASLGYTSLHHIAHDSGGTPVDDEKMVRLLIDHGADVNAESKSGNTPVTLMTWNDREDLVEILVEAGAEPLEEDDCGCT